MTITFMSAWNFFGGLASMLSLIVALKVLKEEHKIEREVDEMQHPEKTIKVHRVPTRGEKFFSMETET